MSGGARNNGKGGSFAVWSPRCSRGQPSRQPCSVALVYRERPEAGATTARRHRQPRAVVPRATVPRLRLLRHVQPSLATQATSAYTERSVRGPSRRCACGRAVAAAHQRIPRHRGTSRRRAVPTQGAQRGETKQSLSPSCTGVRHRMGSVPPCSKREKTFFSSSCSPSARRLLSLPTAAPATCRPRSPRCTLRNTFFSSACSAQALHRANGPPLGCFIPTHAEAPTVTHARQAWPRSGLSLPLSAPTRRAGSPLLAPYLVPDALARQKAAPLHSHGSCVLPRKCDTYSSATNKFPQKRGQGLYVLEIQF